MHEVQFFAFAVSPYIDRNGLPHLPRIVVSPDMHHVMEEGTDQLVSLMDDVTGDDNDPVNVAAMLAMHYHDMELMTPMDILEEIEDDTYEDAPKFYVAIGMDDDDLENLMIDTVGHPEDEDEDEDYPEEEEEDIEADDRDDF